MIDILACIFIYPGMKHQSLAVCWRPGSRCTPNPRTAVEVEAPHLVHHEANSTWERPQRRLKDYGFSTPFTWCSTMLWLSVRKEIPSCDIMDMGWCQAQLATEVHTTQSNLLKKHNHCWSESSTQEATSTTYWNLSAYHLGLISFEGDSFTRMIMPPTCCTHCNRVSGEQPRLDTHMEWPPYSPDLNPIQ